MGGIDWQALDQHIIIQGLVHFQIIIYFFFYRRCRYHLFGQKGRGRSILWLSALPKFGFAGDEDIKSRLTV